MAKTAIARQGGARGRAGVDRKRIRTPIVPFVACKAVDRRVRPPLLAGANVAFRTVGEDVHSGQRKPGHAVNLERPGHLPSRGGMAGVARLQETPAVKVRMAARARALDRAGGVVTGDARRMDVLPRQRET